MYLLREIFVNVLAVKNVFWEISGQIVFILQNSVLITVPDHNKLKL